MSKSRFLVGDLKHVFFINFLLSREFHFIINYVYLWCHSRLIDILLVKKQENKKQENKKQENKKQENKRLVVY